RTEQMDPWNIDIGLIAERFLEMLGTLKEMDFRVPGKIILAAAVMLKIKSNRLLGADLAYFDGLFKEQEEEQGLLDEIQTEEQEEDLSGVKLIPKTPQPRKRKVSIFDLVDALQQAIEVKKRRVMRDIPAVEVEIPKKKVEISQIIKDTYGRIKFIFTKDKYKKLTFSQLIPSESKQDKVYTFIPLLHLTHQRKIDMLQYQHFGEIEIELLKQQTAKQLEKELPESS
ncbi:segregation/condensation protein A, partial [Candidatus Woesearchaeota archaeon]|nr:segregation/condensation protein A [Candidatus Woesearchaeota archaeon]